jgi:hypothetical protein
VNKNSLKKIIQPIRKSEYEYPFKIFLAMPASLQVRQLQENKLVTLIRFYEAIRVSAQKFYSVFKVQSYIPVIYNQDRFASHGIFVRRQIKNPFFSCCPPKAGLHLNVVKFFVHEFLLISKPIRAG